MGRETFNLQMAEPLLENIKMIRRMAMENLPGQMEPALKGSGRMENLYLRQCLSILNVVILTLKLTSKSDL
jgi:hypothetical protein